MPGQDYEKFKADLNKAGTPWYTGDVPGYGAVNFFERAKPGPVLSYVGKAFRCERTFVVWPYESAWGFCSWMLGWSSLGDDPASSSGGEKGNYKGAGVFRQPPQPLPITNKRIKKPLAYATEISRFAGITPSGNSNFDQTLDGSVVPAGDYLAAEVTVVYGSLPYRVVPDDQMPRNADAPSDPDESGVSRYVTRVIVPSSRHVQYPSGALKWEGVGLPKAYSTATPPAEVKTPATQTAGRMLPHAEVNYTWHQVPGLPRAIFTGSIGRVNSVAFDNSQVETLLLVGIDVAPHRMVTGERAYDITYRMRHFDGNAPEPVEAGDTPVLSTYNYASGGHNYFLRFYKPAGTDVVRFVWDRPFSGGPDDASKKWVFEAMDFRDLFRGPFVTGYWTLP